MVDSLEQSQGERKLKGTSPMHRARQQLGPPHNKSSQGISQIMFFWNLNTFFKVAQNNLAFQAFWSLNFIIGFWKRNGQAQKVKN